MSSIIDVKAGDWESTVANETRPVVVEYWHDKCVICKEMKPIYESQPENYGDDIKFTRMNLLESRENRVFAIRNGVRSTPTFIVYCEGRPIGNIIGAREQVEFSDELKMIIEKADSCLRATPFE